MKHLSNYVGGLFEKIIEENTIENINDSIKRITLYPNLFCIYLQNTNIERKIVKVPTNKDELSFPMFILPRPNHGPSLAQKIFDEYNAQKNIEVRGGCVEFVVTRTLWCYPDGKFYEHAVFFSAEKYIGTLDACITLINMHAQFYSASIGWNALSETV